MQNLIGNMAMDFKKNYLDLDGDKTAWFDNVAEKKEAYVSEMSR